MKHILIVSYFFAPQNQIGAVRPTKLAKYLTRMGYRVTVLCGHAPGALADPLLSRDLAELADVRVIRERSLMRWWKERGERRTAPRPAPTPFQPPAPTPAQTPAPPRKSAGTGRLHHLLDVLYRWLLWRADKAFANACVRALRKRGEHFDVVLSSYGPASVHTVANRLKRLRIADKWIADFRDEAAAPFRWQRSWLARYLRAIKAQADAVTAVSGGVAQVMGLTNETAVIPNGFDSDDAAHLPAPALDAGFLHVAYCGQLYRAQRDLRPVFAAVAALRAQNEPLAARVRFHYAGRQGADFIAQAATYGLAGAVVDHGMLTREGSLALQRAADALLAATWNTRTQQGVVTGKLLEYFMADKPVLCCVSGDVPHSEAAALIRRTGAGVAHEQALGEQDNAPLAAYVLRLLRARFAGDPSPYAPNRAEIAAYDYRRTAERMAAVVERV